MPRFALRDIFVLTAIVAIALAGYRFLWNPPPDPNAQAYFACYLAALAFATLAAFLGRPHWRRSCQGFAAYGWMHLIFVLWGGFRLSDIYDALRLIQGVKLGFVLGVLVALLSGWLLKEQKLPEQSQK